VGTVVAIAVGVLRASVRTGVAGKIVSGIVPKIDAMFTTQAHEREHELADENRAADDRAEQEKGTHCQARRK
jgi:hypothetical protein